MTKPADDGDEHEPTDEELDERYVLDGDPEEALRKLLDVKPTVKRP